MRFKVVPVPAVHSAWTFRQFASLLKRAVPLTPFDRRRVLLLEDDASMHRLIAHVLRPLRVKVEHFGNGRAVIAGIAAEGDRYAALLLDLMMPHDGGLSVLRNLREHRPALLRKVILVTGSGAGVTDPWSDLVYAVVHKPFETAALAATVRACVDGDEVAAQPAGRRSIARLVKCMITVKKTA